MRLSDILLLVTASVASTTALKVPSPLITPAPLAARKDQNPLDNFDPNTYLLTDLGPDHPILTLDGNKYHYIEDHTEYLTLETVTATVNNQISTAVSSVKISAATATAGTSDQSAGDVALTFSKDIADLLTTTAEDAVAACGLTTKRKKELSVRSDPLQCMIDQALSISDENGILAKAAASDFWQNLGVQIGEDVGGLIKSAAVKLGPVQEQLYLVGLAFLFGTMAKNAQNIAGSLSTLNIPAKGVGALMKKPSTCDPTKEADETSYICQDPQCDGAEDEKCKRGPDSGCACAVFAKTFTYPGDKAFLDLQQEIFKELETAPYAKPECDMDQISGLPSNVFTGVYPSFCEQVKKNKASSLSQIVDSHGNVIPPRRQRSLKKRTPPANADSYSQYKITLQWSGGDDCDIGCPDSFDALATSPCGHSGAQQNSMATEGKFDRGCGTFSYKIEKPVEAEDPEPPALNVGPLQCTANPGNLKCWKDIHEKAMLDCADEWPKWVPNGGMVGEDAFNLTQVYRPKKNGVTYMMTVGWIPGCKGDPQNVKYPIPDNEDVSWKSLLTRPFYDCPSNNGLGGWHDVGCLRYGFYPNNAGTYGSPPHPERFFDTMSFCG